MNYADLLPQLTANLGDRVFKSWDPFSDGIGNTISDFYAARPDLFGGVDFNAQRKWRVENEESGAGSNYWDFGGANDVLKNYEVRRMGEAGMNDGRRDVVVDKRTGDIVYAGANPYSYDPAKTNLNDAATFLGGALGGYGLVNGLAGLTAGASGSGGGAIAAGGAQGAASLEAAVAADIAASQAAAAASVGTGAGLTATELAALGAGGAAAGGAAGGMLNGAFLGEGVASGIPAWDAAKGSGAQLTPSGITGLLGKAWDFAKENPRLAGGLLGGLLGGTGGGSGGGYSYNGPMPTISRQGWSPTAQANLMPTQSVVQGLPQAQGQQYSGLLRYLGG